MTVLRGRFIGSTIGDNVAMFTPAWSTDMEVDSTNALDAAVDLLEHMFPALDDMSALQHLSWSWDLLELNKVFLVDGHEENLATIPIPINGTGAGENSAAFVAAMVQLLVNGNPRKAKLFYPGLREVDVAGDIVGGPLFGELQNFGATWSSSFVGTLTALQFTPGMWSSAALAFYPAIIGGLVIDEITHQVRRKLGRGD